MENSNIGDIYTESADILRNNLTVCILNTLIALVSIVLLAITVVGLLAIPSIFGGYLKSFLRMINGEKVGVGDFFKDGFNKFGKLLGVSFISLIGIVLGFVCFIIPGIYLCVRWFFVVHLIVDKDVSIGEAFEYSGKMSKGVFWNVFTIIVLNAIINGIAETVIIGFVLAMPFTYIVSCKYYFDRLNTIK